MYKKLALTACICASLPALSNDRIKPDRTDDSYQQVIIKLKPELSAEGYINDLQSSGRDISFLDYSSQERQSLLNELEVLTDTSLEHVREMSGKADVFRLPQTQNLQEVQQALQAITGHQDILYAEPDRKLFIARTPNDTRYGEQWHYYEQRAGANLPPAWDITTGSAVTVAVIDTGHRSHGDINAKILPGYDLISSTSTANDGDGRDPDPTDVWAGSGYHGVHVAGTVGSISNNNNGVAGVSWGARILPVRVLGRGGGTLSDVADGIAWSVGVTVPGVPRNNNPAKVINMSLGGGGSCSQTMQNSINVANALGAVVVVAAGNNNAPISGFTPANCGNVLRVTSVNRMGNKSSFSNHSAGSTVAAPGGGDFNQMDDVLSLGGNGDYTYKRGTSMAAPHVSGVAALVLSQNGGLTSAQVRNLILNNARPFPTGSNCNTSLCGSGILDARETLVAIGGPGTATVKMIANYRPVGSTNRTSYVLNQPASPTLEFEYNESMGNFEERPGGICNTGQNNPSYFKIKFDVSPAHRNRIESCNFRGSWDANTISCQPVHIDIVKNGDWVTLNTDTFATDPASCELFDPLRQHLLPFQDAWFHVNIVIDGVNYSRRMNFRKEFDIQLP
ncbi:S8 family serine peptidase [Marinicella sp. W31]|uniref:S8 family serine peptidase n=1 Tax=Marinicella sp. W31 TaxID=3023713 RepID=UPI0037584A1F